MMLHDEISLVFASSLSLERERGLFFIEIFLNVVCLKIFY